MSESSHTVNTIFQTGHAESILSVAISPDNRYLASVSSGDSAIKIWNRETGILIRNCAGHSGWIQSVAFSPDGQYLLTGAWDGTARLWKVDTGECVHFYRWGHINAVCFVSFGEEYKVVTGGANSQIHLWDLEGERPIKSKSFSGHEKAILTLTVSKNGKYLASGSMDKTAKLWDLNQGTLLKSYPHEDFVHAVVIDPSENPSYLITAAAGSQKTHNNPREEAKPQTIKKWDINDRESNEPVYVFSGHSDNIYDADISKDGRYLASTCKDGSIGIWSLEEGQEKHLFSFSDFGQTMDSLCFGSIDPLDPDSLFLVAGGYGKKTLVWNVLKKDQEPQIYTGPESSVFISIMSPDGHYVVEGSDGNDINLWDLHKGEFINSLNKSSNHGRVISLDFSPEGNQLLSANTLWNIQDDTSEQFDNPQWVNSARFSEDGNYFTTGVATHQKGLARLWKSGSKTHFKERNEHKAVWDCHADIHSEKGYWVIAYDHYDNVGKEDGERIVDLELIDFKQDKYYTLSHHTNRIRGVRMSKDGRYLATACHDGYARLWNIENPQDQLQPIREFQESSWVISIDISKDGRYVLTGSRDNMARLWDRDNPKEPIHIFKGHTSEVYAHFSPDGKYILTASKDSTTKIWDRASGKEIVMLVSIGEKDWAVVAPSGLFDASPGAMRNMHFVDGMKVIELDQLKKRYYEPGLLARIFGHKEGELRDVSDFDDIGLYPLVKNIKIEEQHLKIELEERDGGIGKTSVFINGKEILEDANPPEPKDSKRRDSFSLDLEPYKRHFIPAENNNISVRVYNEEGWLKSKVHELSYWPDFVSEKGFGKKAKAQNKQSAKGPIASLYAILVGTSKYDKEDLSLDFPDHDATSVANTLELVGKKLFKETNVQLLVSNPKKKGIISSKENIAEAFKKVSEKSGPQDVLFIYFSGHGDDYGKGDLSQFYYLTKELKNKDLRSQETRDIGTISTGEMMEWIKKIPARKQVMIFDTCYSGSVVKGLSNKKGMDSTRERALDEMKDRTGMWVLAGSASDQVSFEASLFGQGLLTYSLLKGIKGVALRDDNTVKPLIDVRKLLSYSKDEVPKLATRIAKKQDPVLVNPDGDGATFSIGIAEKSMQAQIKLAEPKPIFARCIFQHRDEYNDPLELSNGLDGRFKSFNHGKKDVSFIFVNVHDFIDAFAVRGLYGKKGKDYEVKGKVFKNGKAVANFQLTDKDSNSLIDQLEKKIHGLVLK